MSTKSVFLNFAFFLGGGELQPDSPPLGASMILAH